MARIARLSPSRVLILLALLGCSARSGRRRERVFYVGIVEDRWNYAPSGKNLLSGKAIADDGDAAVFLQSDNQSIGAVYKKAMFRQYTDASYSRPAPRPEWLGFLGPILRAEVDDVIVVHLKNFASRNYSMHPHGVFYKKDAEGAMYPDGTSGRLKEDDSVPPGGSYTYRWEVRPEFAPTDGDADCLTWVYHSHLDAPRDIASGLIGALLTCKKGVLKETNEPIVTKSARNDVDQDVFLMFSVVDENLSWYLEENIREYIGPVYIDQEDQDFEESNLMHAINGYVFGNLPGISLCQHRRVSWHLFGMGNEVDIHSAYFHGNTLLDRGHRTDVLSLFPATFATAEMVPKARGKWLLSCQVNDHFEAGMAAFYEVKACDGESGATVAEGAVRTYYLAAEKLLWNYAPSDRDLINNVSLTEADSPSEVFFGRGDGRLGGQYLKVLYREYTDGTFTTRKPPESFHLGLLGPVLRAEEGDTVRVTFMNMADGHYSIEAHGLQDDRLSPGSSSDSNERWMGATPGSQVAPGENFTYTWKVLDGPSASDPPCVPYLYYSATDPIMDTNSGLVGPLLVCKKGTLAQGGTQEKEFFLLFSVMDENMSRYFGENVKHFGTKETDIHNEDFQESNKMHAVNGLMYGNLDGLDMCAGDAVRWYVFGLGSEVDIHGVYFEGNTFDKHSTTRDTVSVFPHTTATFSMRPSTPGVYEVSCRVTDHFSAGMRQLYRVNYCPQRKVKATQTRPAKVVEYFIGAEEIEWDYSPERHWELEKHSATPENSPGSIFVQRGKDRIGSRYKKVVYREYTDDSFRVHKERNGDQEHLGIMGPVIKAEVGEQIVITFKNLASRPYSIGAHGVRASGAHVPVQPGHILGLTWDVPVSSGPGPSDPTCITYAYYSRVNFIKDLYSGLLGPLVICRPGTLQHGAGADRRRADVDKEFALLFMVHDENQSWYLEDNIRTYLEEDPDAFEADQEFEESNLMHGINGKVYGNLHGLEMTQGQRVDWYLLGMGNEVDMHTVHFHAETFTYRTDRVHRADVFDLFPGTFQTLEMVAGNPGTWLLHCHVTDHIHAGMETTFTIKASGADVSSNTVLLILTLSLLAAGGLH
ncbi:ferroxidase HEPHL1-like [Betta splendens]|uniref:ferroxidase n=1 Tax=Betta splendens TaxID=158456 RepID=A0A6P7P9E8_BETSP|nr:ferroxidase HEPHL1-like [Betta splendens]